VGPALLAMLEHDPERRVRLLLAIGGYRDTTAAVTFFTTGHYRETPEGEWRHRSPNPYGKWAFVLANADRLRDPADRQGLAAIAGRKLQDPEAEVADLTRRLGPEGRGVMALIDNRDPDRVPALIAALPPRLRANLEALDLARRDLSGLDAAVILIHGRDDPVIPSSESRALAAALPEDRASLYVVDSLAHVELGPGGMRDILRLWRAAYALLRERDALPRPDPDRCFPHQGGPGIVVDAGSALPR
jgi:pimeloyl-ACP methyl ester carboxylesterase